MDAVEGVREQTRGASAGRPVSEGQPLQSPCDKLDRVVITHRAAREAFAVLRRIVENANAALHEACAVSACPSADEEASTFSGPSIIARQRRLGFWYAASSRRC